MNDAPKKVAYESVVAYKLAPDKSAFTNDALVRFWPLKSTPRILSPDKSTLGPPKNPALIVYPDPTVNTGGLPVVNVIPDDFTPMRDALVNMVFVRSTLRIAAPFRFFDVKFKLGPIMNDELALLVTNV
jgi:hypothetical protein